jgi:hypothetical protein
MPKPIQHSRIKYYDLRCGEASVAYTSDHLTPSVLTLTVKAFAGNSQSTDTSLNLFSPPRSAVMVTGPCWDCDGRAVADASIGSEMPNPLKAMAGKNEAASGSREVKGAYRMEGQGLHDGRLHQKMWGQ